MSKKATPSEPTTATFIATAHLCENGEHFKPGDTITLTPERAAALGDLVKPAEG